MTNNGAINATGAKVRYYLATEHGWAYQGSVTVGNYRGEVTEMIKSGCGIIHKGRALAVVFANDGLGLAPEVFQITVK
jgi:hypothetical protein